MVRQLRPRFSGCQAESANSQKMMETPQDLRQRLSRLTLWRAFRGELQILLCRI